MTHVTGDWTRVMPEEEEAVRRVAVILGEWNWDARRLTQERRFSHKPGEDGTS